MNIFVVAVVSAAVVVVVSILFVLVGPCCSPIDVEGDQRNDGGPRRRSDVSLDGRM